MTTHTTAKTVNIAIIGAGLMGREIAAAIPPPSTGSTRSTP